MVLIRLIVNYDHLLYVIDALQGAVSQILGYHKGESESLKLCE